MPKLGGVFIIAMGLEDPAFLSAVHGHEPGSVLELGPAVRHRVDLPTITAIPMYELDRAQHVHLANHVVEGPWRGRRREGYGWWRPGATVPPFAMASGDPPVPRGVTLLGRGSEHATKLWHF